MGGISRLGDWRKLAWRRLTTPVADLLASSAFSNPFFSYPGKA